MQQVNRPGPRLVTLVYLLRSAYQRHNLCYFWNPADPDSGGDDDEFFQSFFCAFILSVASQKRHLVDFFGKQA
jgi:hypothetical protein